MGRGLGEEQDFGEEDRGPWGSKVALLKGASLPHLNPLLHLCLLFFPLPPNLSLFLLIRFINFLQEDLLDFSHPSL